MAWERIENVCRSSKCKYKTETEIEENLRESEEKNKECNRESEKNEAKNNDMAKNASSYEKRQRQ